MLKMLWRPQKPWHAYLKGNPWYTGQLLYMVRLGEYLLIKTY